jgi:hypothetical protein
MNLPSSIRFSTFPRTEPPPAFVEDVAAVFRQHEGEIATETNGKCLKLEERRGPRRARTDLAALGSQVGACVIL